MDSSVRKIGSWVWLWLDTCIRLSPAVLCLVFGIGWLAAAAYLAFAAPSVVIRISLRYLALNDGKRRRFVFVVYRTQLVVMLFLLVIALATKAVLLSILLGAGLIVPSSTRCCCGRVRSNAKASSSRRSPQALRSATAEVV